jgi:hypothetical protein
MIDNLKAFAAAILGASMAMPMNHAIHAKYALSAIMTPA